MKNLAAPALVSILVLFSGAATAQGANSLPEEAKIHYPRGEAPFYVRVRSYARHLDRLYEPDIDPSAKNREAAAIGIDVVELELIRAVLSGYRDREQQARAEGWRQECIPMLRGDPISEEQARAAFERLDDDGWKEVVADQTLDELENRRGAAIADKVRQRIIAQGEAIEFTTSAWAKVIELGRGGLFVSHMMIECGTHPDYPKR